MSRTVRCKSGKAGPWSREFTRLCADKRAVVCKPEREGGRLVWVYYEAKGRERWEALRYWIGESRHANQRSPSRGYRRADTRLIRRIAKDEARKWGLNPSHEPIIPKKNAFDVMWSWR